MVMHAADAFRVAWYRFARTLRRQWTGYLAIALLLGLVGGLAMGSVAAARRTQGAYPAYLAATNPSDLTVLTGISGPGRRARLRPRGHQEDRRAAGRPACRQLRRAERGDPRRGREAGAGSVHRRAAARQPGRRVLHHRPGHRDPGAAARPVPPGRDRDRRQGNPGVGARRHRRRARVLHERAAEGAVRGQAGHAGRTGSGSRSSARSSTAPRKRRTTSTPSATAARCSPPR